MNIDIFIPARLDSFRLPKKHLKEIEGKPIIKLLIDRLKKAKKIRHIIVCTTDQNYDDPLIEFLKENNILYFRGNEKDVLIRFLNAAKHFGTDIIIDVEGDKIYTDPRYVDKIAIEMVNSNLDFVMGSNSSHKIDHSNHSIAAVFPAGIRTTSLQKVCSLKKITVTETGYREFFTSNKLFNCKYIKPIINTKIPNNLRLTLDYQEDYELAKEIFKELGNDFYFEDILQLLHKKPQLLKITKPAIKKWKENYEKNITNFSIN